MPAALHQPYDQGNNASEEDKRKQKDKKNPTPAAHGSYIASHSRLWVAPYCSRDGGKVTGYLRPVFE